MSPHRRTLDYPVYRPALRRAMKAAAWLLGLPTNARCSHELTNWCVVDNVVDSVLAEIDTVARPVAVSAYAC